MRLYHGTSAAFVSEILEEGLIGQGATAHDYGGRRPDLDQPPTVHLAPTPGAAADWAEMFHGMEALGEGEYAVLEVDVEGLDVEEGWDGPGTFAVKGTIAPERIRVYEMLTERERTRRRIMDRRVKTLRDMAAELRREADEMLEPGWDETWRLIREGVPGGHLLVAALDLESAARHLEEGTPRG